MPSVKVSYRATEKSIEEVKIERKSTMNKEYRRIDSSSSGYLTPLLPKLAYENSKVDANFSYKLVDIST